MPTPPDLLPPFSAELPLVAELDAMLQAAFEIQGAGIGCWAWNIQTGEIRVNDEWAAIVGYTLAELQPKTIATWHTLTHPEDLRRSERQIARYLNGDTESYECECRMRHKDGQWVWVLIAFSVCNRRDRTLLRLLAAGCARGRDAGSEGDPR